MGVSEVVNVGVGLYVPELEVPEIIAVVPYSSVLTPLVVDLLSLSVVVIEVLISGVVSLPVTTMYNYQCHMKTTQEVQVTNFGCHLQRYNSFDCRIYFHLR